MEGRTGPPCYLCNYLEVVEVKFWNLRRELSFGEAYGVPLNEAGLNPMLEMEGRAISDSHLLWEEIKIAWVHAGHWKVGGRGRNWVTYRGSDAFVSPDMSQRLGWGVNTLGFLMRGGPGDCQSPETPNVSPETSPETSNLDVLRSVLFLSTKNTVPYSIQSIRWVQIV